MSKNDFLNHIQRRWLDKIKREEAERIRFVDEFTQCRPRYIEIGCCSDENVSLAEADSEGRIEYE